MFSVISIIMTNSLHITSFGLRKKSSLTSVYLCLLVNIKTKCSRVDTLDSDYGKDCLAGIHRSVLHISVKEDNLNDDDPVASDSDRDVSSVGSESENEDSDFILCPM